MAETTFSSISSALATLLDDRVVSQINRATVLPQLLPTQRRPGKDFSWVAQFGTAVGAATADGADVNAFNNDTKVPASLPYAIYTDPFAITGLALALARNTGNPQDLVNLFGDEMADSVERLAVGIAGGIYTGTGTGSALMGLCDPTAGAILDTGSYAGLSRSTYPQWAATVDGNGGTPRALSFALMRGMRSSIYIASGEQPDLIVTTPALFGKYGDLFGTNRHFVQDVYLRGQKIALDGGHQALLFDGIPVVQDVLCPAGEMLFLNTSRLEIRQPQDPDEAVTQSRGGIAVAGTPEEQFGQPTGKIMARINPLGRTGDKYKFQLIAYLAFGAKRPNTLGRITDLDATL